jgi:predicted dithiol-disulfide oxidoreductase (DUF899 family)
MTEHRTGTREEWIKARLKLLEAEKELTKHTDEVTRQRQSLPWVKVDKEYKFDTEDGEASLADLFRGRSQLIIYHFMFGPDYSAGCPSCSAIADSFNGSVPHLIHHDVMFWAVSRARLEKLLAYRKRMGWSFPWASSGNGDFNFDFNASFTEEQQREGAYYNFGKNDPGMKTAKGALDNPVSNRHADMTDTTVSVYLQQREGMSTFVRKDGVIYHAYSAYARGVDAIWNMYAWFDRAPLGRNEEKPWMRRHDEYDQA